MFSFLIAFDSRYFILLMFTQMSKNPSSLEKLVLINRNLNHLLCSCAKATLVLLSFTQWTFIDCCGRHSVDFYLLVTLVATPRAVPFAYLCVSIWVFCMFTFQTPFRLEVAVWNSFLQWDVNKSHLGSLWKRLCCLIKVTHSANTTRFLLFLPRL